jgi:predicted adenine nucleotide alpha hydrolase (AANH) superfamily ATPase
VLRELGHQPTLFFSNSNIYPEEEHNKRLREVLKLAGIADVPLIIDDPAHDEWLNVVANGKEGEPERGPRCALCFKYALQKTFARMQERGLDLFTTTLTVSPHKSSDLIAAIGKEISKSAYLDVNFKKQNGFKRTLELSEEYELYRQSYCGCEFSMRQGVK